ncbi:MAG: c-type cytochrome, partial [Nitrospiria bacterium]
IGKRIQAFWQAVIFWLGSYVILKYLIFPPIPGHLFLNYMGLITLVIFLYISSQDQLWEEFKDPIIATLSAKSPIYSKIRLGFFFTIPIITWIAVTDVMVPRFTAPIELRNPHPAPPHEFFIHGKKLAYGIKSPFRVDEKGKYDERVEDRYSMANPFDDKGIPYVRYLKEGGEIYFQECHYCHGANLDSKGIFAFAFNPLPANLSDPGSIAQVEESYVLWKVAKGGIGMPSELFPWSSAMPAYKDFISIDDMWKVTEFIYWESGYFPRTWE